MIRNSSISGSDILLLGYLTLRNLKNEKKKKEKREVEAKAERHIFIGWELSESF